MCYKNLISIVVENINVSRVMTIAGHHFQVSKSRLVYVCIVRGLRMQLLLHHHVPFITGFKNSNRHSKWCLTVIFRGRRFNWRNTPGERLNKRPGEDLDEKQQRIEIYPWFRTIYGEAILILTLTWLSTGKDCAYYLLSSLKSCASILRQY